MLGIRQDALPGSFRPVPAGNRNLFSAGVSSFEAAALSPERPGWGRLGEATAIYRSQDSSAEPSEMFRHRESRRNDRSVCSLKYKNGFIFRHHGGFFFLFFF